MGLKEEIAYRINHIIEYGLCDDLKIKEKLSIEEEGCNYDLDIWCGETKIDPKLTIKLICSNESVYSNKISIFSITNGPIYVIDGDEFLSIRDRRVLPISIKEQARVLIGFEMLLEYGCLWKKCTDYKELLETLYFYAGENT